MASTVLLASPTRRYNISRATQYRLFLAALFFADVVALTLAFVIAYVIRFQFAWTLFDDTADSREIHIFIAAASLPIWLFVFLLSELYNTHYLFSSTQEYKKVFGACSTAFMVVVIGTYLVPFVRVSRGWLALAVIGAVGLVIFTRFTFRHFAYFLRSHRLLTARTVIVGTDHEARAVAHQLKSWTSCGAEIIGFVDNFTPPGTKIEGSMEVIGSLDSLQRIVDSLDVDELIVSASALPREDVLWVFQSFGNSDKVELRFSPGLFEIFTSGVRVKEIGSVPLVSMRKVRLDGIETAVKMFTDYTIALLALTVLAIPLLITAVLVKLDSPGPILHRRRVLGRRGRPFDAFKFRTMHVNGDEILAKYPGLKEELEINQKLKVDPRVTRIGQWLRKYSIDELPQLFNVLLDQMSIVGPRMITPAEVEKYGKWRLNLWTVKPGITGLWQVSGRSDVSYAERVRLDLYYIRNYTFWFDIQILWRTIPVIFGGKGAY